MKAGRPTVSVAVVVVSGISLLLATLACSTSLSLTSTPGWSMRTSARATASSGIWVVALFETTLVQFMIVPGTSLARSRVCSIWCEMS